MATRSAAQPLDFGNETLYHREVAAALAAEQVSNSLGNAQLAIDYITVNVPTHLKTDDALATSQRDASAVVSAIEPCDVAPATPEPRVLW